MKINALIPFAPNYKSEKNSVSQRAKILLGGSSLIERSIEALNKTKSIKDIYVYSSDESIKKSLSKSQKYTFLKRDKSLDSPTTSIEEIIESFFKLVETDILVLLHPRKPFLKSSTIEECILKVKKKSHDSSFIANNYKRLAWYKNKPVNFDIKSNSTPHLEKLEPIKVEASTLYVILKEKFLKTRNRIGKNPFIKEIGDFEGFEVDKKDDREIAELIINAGLDRNINEQH